MFFACPSARKLISPPRLRLLAACGIATVTPSAVVVAEPIITDVQLSGNQITLLFRDDGSSNQFELQRNPNLDPSNWSAAPSATLTDIGGGSFRYTLARTAADKQFFRIIGSFLGSGLDPDGDGLPTTLEQSLSTDPNSPDYSNPARFDTDGDGFSDGVEYAVGTKPNDPNSFPNLAGFPAVEFAEPISPYVEGSSVSYNIPITLDKPYTGAIYYTVNERSTARAPVDYTPLSGSVFVNGTSGTINVTFVDDRVVRTERLLLLDLDPDAPAAGPYRVGGGATHVVCLSDNDCYWTGALKDERSERGFRVRILRQRGQNTQVEFVAGSSDGLPVVDGGASSQSTGIIPAAPVEVWPATGVSDTVTRFRAVSPPMPVATTAFTGFGGKITSISTEPLDRILILDASPLADSGHRIDQSTRLVGSYVETLQAADSTKTYLNRTMTGIFALAKDLPEPADLPSPFVPTP